MAPASHHLHKQAITVYSGKHYECWATQCCAMHCLGAGFAVLPDAGNYRDVCVALRQEHDREVAISQQLVVSHYVLHV